MGKGQQPYVEGPDKAGSIPITLSVKEIIKAVFFLLSLGIVIGGYLMTINRVSTLEKKLDSIDQKLEILMIQNAKIEERTLIFDETQKNLSNKVDQLLTK